MASINQLDASRFSLHLLAAESLISGSSLFIKDGNTTTFTFIVITRMPLLSVATFTKQTIEAHDSQQCPVTFSVLFARNAALKIKFLTYRGQQFHLTSFMMRQGTVLTGFNTVESRLHYLQNIAVGDEKNHLVLILGFEICY